MIKIKPLLTTLLLSLSLSGCGAGEINQLLCEKFGNSSSCPVEYTTGVFIDSAVSGLTYKSVEVSGTTDENGTFRYAKKGEVTFSVGGVDLGTVDGAAMLTPLDLAGSDDVHNNQVVNTVRLLQSLDSDGDPDNGITIEIPDDADTSAIADSIDVTASTAVFESNANLTTLIAALREDGDGSVVDLDTAVTHLQESLNTELDLEITYSIGGTLTGLDDGLSLILSHDDGTTVTLSDNGSFLFPNGWSTDDSYTLSISQQPDFPLNGHYCQFADSSNSGTIESSNVSDVTIECGIHIALQQEYFQTAAPSSVTMVVKAYNAQTGANIENLALSTDDDENSYALDVQEDSGTLQTTETFPLLTSIDEINQTIRSVLVLDISTSLTQDDLDDLKTSAISFIEKHFSDTLTAVNREMAIYTFDDTVYLTADFSSDADSLTDAVNGISRGMSSTNLYGALETALDSFDNMLEPNDTGSYDLEYGFVILITDGVDNTDLTTLSDVITARGDKEVFTIGVGDDVDETVLSQIAQTSDQAELTGEESVFSLTDYTDLDTALDTIYSRINNYADGMYLLNYQSPKRDSSHTLSLAITDNEYTGTDAELSDSFDADSFYSQLVVSGLVTGLSDRTVTLKNTLDDDTPYDTRDDVSYTVEISRDGAFLFTQTLEDAQGYTVTVDTQPTGQAVGQSCSVTNGSGSVDGQAVTDVLIDCSESTRMVLTSYKVLSTDKLDTDSPSIVTVILRAQDANTGETVTNVSFDDATSASNYILDLSEGAQSLDSMDPEYSITLEPVSIYSLYTVLMLDISGSIASQGTDEWTAIKSAAIEAISSLKSGADSTATPSVDTRDSRLLTNQWVAVYTFDDDLVLQQTFTNDLATLLDVLNNLEQSDTDEPSTDLLCHLITGLGSLDAEDETANTPSWDEMYTANDITTGFVMLFTDGVDTAKNCTTTEVQTAITGHKNVISIMVGDDADTDTLAAISTTNFFDVPYIIPVDDTDRIVDTLDSIYGDFMVGLNRVLYASPAREDEASNTNDLLIEVVDNTDTSDNATVEEVFSSQGFSDFLGTVQSVIFAPASTRLDQEITLKGTLRWWDGDPETFSWAILPETWNATITVDDTDDSLAVLVASEAPAEDETAIIRLSGANSGKAAQWEIEVKE
ncbi:MAG: VWA domain-containing protein [Magnetococcales bacterium]|nr:VWA domain-containing protein [Magnetococcales bacterium]